MDIAHAWALARKTSPVILTSNTSEQLSAPRITVLMSVYNGARYFRASIDSILRQTFADFEFLIVDDGSTDETMQILRSYRDERIKIVRNEKNIGLTKSLNRGLVLASGEYIARQDADDISLPDRLQKQVAFMETHSGVVLLGTQAKLIDARGRRRRLTAIGCYKATSSECLRWQMMFDAGFFHTSVMFRREPLMAMTGGYNERFVTGQDADLWSRLPLECEIRNLNEALVCFRVHRDSMSFGVHRWSQQSINGANTVFLRGLRRNIGHCFSVEPWIRAQMNIVAGRVITCADAELVIEGFVAIFEQYKLRAATKEDLRQFRVILANRMRFIALLLLDQHRGSAVRLICYALSVERRLNPIFYTKCLMQLVRA
jgi:glycosyltransferase involved in cell wall biosynthesis